MQEVAERADVALDDAVGDLLAFKDALIVAAEPPVELPTPGRIYPDPLVKMNAADASNRGIKQDDMVEVESRTGKIQLKAGISEDVTPGVVTIDFGWGNPTDKKASINSLSPDDVWDPVSGGYPNRLFLCEVKKG